MEKEEQSIEQDLHFVVHLQSYDDFDELLTIIDSLWL